MPLDPTQHLGLARLVASRFRSAPDREAVVGAAVLALVEKAPDFEEERGNAPSSFLWFHLLGAAQAEARRQWRQEAERLYRLDDNGEERERDDLPTVAPHDGTGVLLDRLRQELARLDEQDREILVRRFGLAGPEETFPEIAATIGLSPAWTRQLAARALRRLRRGMERRTGNTAFSAFSA